MPTDETLPPSGASRVAETPQLRPWPLGVRGELGIDEVALQRAVGRHRPGPQAAPAHVPAETAAARAPICISSELSSPGVSPVRWQRTAPPASPWWMPTRLTGPPHVQRRPPGRRIQPRQEFASQRLRPFCRSRFIRPPPLLGSRRLASLHHCCPQASPLTRRGADHTGALSPCAPKLPQDPDHRRQRCPLDFSRASASR